MKNLNGYYMGRKTATWHYFVSIFNLDTMSLIAMYIGVFTLLVVLSLILGVVIVKSLPWWLL